MPSQRLTLALEQVTSADWAVFEKFAAEFLAIEYPSLRTMASPAGDRGRDGELYCPSEVSDTAIQYSVTKDWKGKIRATVRKLSDTMPHVIQLIYATSQVVGPAADDLRVEMREGFGVSLDVRDQSWFVEREQTYQQRQVASEELAVRFVDPLLSARGLKDRVAPTLTHDDSKIALLHLSLDAADHASEKGLTKSAFESLVLAALHDTTAEARLTRPAVTAAVQAMLPAGHEAQVAALAESALARLSRKGGAVNHHRSTDDYCLPYAKRVEMQEQAAQFLRDEEHLEGEIRAALVGALPDFGEEEPTTCAEAAHELRHALEQLFIQRGESFASAVQTGEAQQIDPNELIETVARDESVLLKAVDPEQASAIVRRVVERPSPPTQRHLRRLADAYTLFAFLREAPDVQRVVVRLFADGDVWLDTNVVLPLLAETLLVERTERHYTVLLRAALDAGLRLHVTDGVVEEVERHINRSLTFARTATDQWRSRVPFLYAVYASTGRSRAEFSDWAASFAGNMRPKEDVREYLADVFGITHRDLTEEADAASLELRSAVQEVWHQIHDRRRASADEDLDQITRLRLVAHDVENCVGVIGLRRGASSSPMGYRAWFLTLDRTALGLGRELRSRLGHGAPASPALSPDFLTEFLRLGPVRTAVERDARINLPLLTDISMYENMPIELIELAERVRRESAGLDERVTRRRVRDALDEARLRPGDEAKGGMKRAQHRLVEAIARQSPE